MSNIFDVIVIDDDQIFTKTLKNYLNDLGLRVTTISDASLAAALDFKNFKIVLLDLDIPPLSGHDILRKIPVVNRPLVIMISAFHDIDTRISLLSDGADYFLCKPINLSEVGLIVQRAVGRISSKEQHHEPWRLSKRHFKIITPIGNVFGLSYTEFTVLETLFSKYPNSVSLDELEHSVGTRGNITGNNFRRSLEVMLSKMRKRYGTENLPFPVKSIRNMGYIFHGTCEIVDSTDLPPPSGQS